MIKLILPGSIRSKKNSKRIVGRGQRKFILPSTAYLKWEKEARKAVTMQLRFGFVPLTIPIVAKVMAYYKGQQPDLSGVLESVGDCLEGLVWENDRQIISWDGSRLFHDLKNPRTEIEIMGGER
jgi:Holliday junction resolvase RusA-like endonuclease